MIHEPSTTSRWNEPQPRHRHESLQFSRTPPRHSDQVSLGGRMRIAAPKHSTTTTNHIDENLLPTPSCPKHHAFPFLNDNRFILSREQRNYFSLTTTTCTILPPSSLSLSPSHTTRARRLSPSPQAATQATCQPNEQADISTSPRHTTASLSPSNA